MCVRELKPKVLVNRKSVLEYDLQMLEFFTIKQKYALKIITSHYLHINNTTLKTPLPPYISGRCVSTCLSGKCSYFGFSALPKLWNENKSICHNKCPYLLSPIPTSMSQFFCNSYCIQFVSACMI